MYLARAIFISFLIINLIIVSSCEKRDNSIVHIPGNGVTDIEGNNYSTVIIGDQEWMSENLKTNLYDGTGLWVKRTNDHLYAGTNLSGFHAIPGGMANKSQSVSNTFSNKDTLASFWAIPENVNNAITYQLITPQVEKLEIHGDLAKEEVFYSVRCIKSK